MKAMKPMKASCLLQYAQERATLTEQDIDQILEQGKKWSLANTFRSKGSAFFPHTYIRECGYQAASIVHSILDSGTDQAVLLGVLHPLDDRLLHSRKLEIDGKDISNESCWGILGPGIAKDSAWKNEFSLDNFLFLWNEEINRRGIRPPRLLVRYPCLVNRQPEKIPGIEELKKEVRDSVVVATADLCHHGVAYDEPLENVFSISEKGLQFAKDTIEKGLKIMNSDNYDIYYQYCLQAKSDSLDVGTMLRYLLGPITGTILDLKLVDVSGLFENDPQPSWVAATLVKFEPSR